MSVYCMSDIHGHLDEYLQMLERIRFCDADTLYVLGDVLDRGADGIRVLQDMMYRPNVIPLIGNHEYMALHCLRDLSLEVTEDSLAGWDAERMRALLDWQSVGGDATIRAFRALSPDEREDVLLYLEEFSLYETLLVSGRKFILVHAGRSGFAPDRPLDTYTPYETLFDPPDYERVYFPGIYLVTGHLPVFAIPGEHPKDRVLIRNNHICLDLGMGFGGTLGAVRLDDLETFSLI